MINKLVNGFRVFKANYISGNSSDLFDKLVTMGQEPEVLVIACSDSRLDPAILTNSQPGDIFTVRNIAAMVPAFDEDGHAHGTSAAVDYAVSVLKVKHIIVMGHALCGGIRALAESPDDLDQRKDILSSWISISLRARDAVRRYFPGLPIDEKARRLEQTSLLVSMKNLLTFPSVHQRVAAGDLEIHAWYFDMPNGKLLNYDPEAKKFRSLLAGHTMPAVTSETCGCEDRKLSLDSFLTAMKEEKDGEAEKEDEGFTSSMLKAMYALPLMMGALI